MYNVLNNSSRIIRKLIYFSVCSLLFEMNSPLQGNAASGSAKNTITDSTKSKTTAKEYKAQDEYNLDIATYLSQSQYPKEVIEGAKLIHSRINSAGPLKNHFDEYSLDGDKYGYKWDAVEGGRRFSTKNFTQNELKALNLNRFVQKKGKNKGKLSVNQDNWIEVMSGVSEKTWISNLRRLPAPTVYSAADIDAAYKNIAVSDQGSQSVSSPIPIFYLVNGVGVNGLHKTPLGSNSILQIASRFNFTESMRGVSAYIIDHTQGPQACIEATIGTMYRQAHVVNNGTTPHALDEIFSELSFPVSIFYRDGFMFLENLNEAQKLELLSVLKQKIDSIGVLPQWVMNEISTEFSMPEQLHVLCSAPDFSKEPAVGTTAYEIARLLIVKQYEVIGKLAAIRSKQTGEVVPLHLTLLGMGVFHNNPLILDEAFISVAKAISSVDAKVKVFIHGYSSKDIQMVQKHVNNNLKSKSSFILSKPIDRDTFKIITPGEL